MTDRMAAMGETGELIKEARGGEERMRHSGMTEHAALFARLALALEHAAAREAKMRHTLAKISESPSYWGKIARAALGDQ